MNLREISSNLVIKNPYHTKSNDSEFFITGLDWEWFKILLFYFSLPPLFDFLKFDALIDGFSPDF